MFSQLQSYCFPLVLDMVTLIEVFYFRFLFLFSCKILKQTLSLEQLQMKYDCSVLLECELHLYEKLFKVSRNKRKHFTYRFLFQMIYDFWLFIPYFFQKSRKIETGQTYKKTYRVQHFDILCIVTQNKFSSKKMTENLLQGIRNTKKLHLTKVNKIIITFPLFCSYKSVAYFFYRKKNLRG